MGRQVGGIGGVLSPASSRCPVRARCTVAGQNPLGGAKALVLHDAPAVPGLHRCVKAIGVALDHNVHVERQGALADDVQHQVADKAADDVDIEVHRIDLAPDQRQQVKLHRVERGAGARVNSSAWRPGRADSSHSLIRLVRCDDADDGAAVVDDGTGPQLLSIMRRRSTVIEVAGAHGVLSGADEAAHGLIAHAVGMVLSTSRPR